MATDETNEAGSLDKVTENVSKIDELSRRVVQALSHQRKVPTGLSGPSTDLYVKAASAYLSEMMQNPSKVLEHQVAYWSKTLKHHVDASQAMMSGHLTAPDDPTGKDRRFASEVWDQHPYFNYIKQQYLLSAEAITSAVNDLDELEPRDRSRLDYFSRQIVDMFSPTNFLATNPDALAKAVETEGQSLVTGLENLVRDLEENGGDLVVSLADKDAFQLGGNIGTTKGEVVYRNRMMELIQYTPTTEKVHKTPLIIFPPWINKFYILDLKEKNSLIKWIVDQGYTLFVVSWVNPDPSYADTGLGDYIEEGYMEAVNVTKEITGEDKVNVVGYCIAGTTLSLTLAMKKKRKQNDIKSATFFTTLTDFSDQGEVGVFLDNDFVDAIEEEVGRAGVLDKFFMSRTFSYLRSNDLIYGPAIKSYMMGEAPPAFDLLYWNGDGTNLPAKMSVEYLRGLCQTDTFATTGFEVLGETAQIKEVDVPVCAIACETDHIAAWKSSYRGVQKMGSKNKTFILSESGHIAGIVNPPSKKKYGHYTNANLTATPEDWQAAAKFNEGSWWPAWDAWLKKKSGAKVAARKPGSKTYPPLCPAPGTYVLSQNTV